MIICKKYKTLIKIYSDCELVCGMRYDEARLICTDELCMEVFYKGLSISLIFYDKLIDCTEE